MPSAGLFGLWANLSVSKLLCMVHQSLFHRLVSCQNNHLLGSKMDGEHCPISLGQLGVKRGKLVHDHYTFECYLKHYFRITICYGIPADMSYFKIGLDLLSTEK